jgi:hypothetical protein
MTARPPISPSSALPAVATFTIPENNEELGEAITRLAGHINISYSKVRAMTRAAATPENEAHLLQVARHGTAQHVA